MRILVISDNHGDWATVTHLLATVPHDYAIHLGDAEVDEARMRHAFNRYVGGNHDYNYQRFEDVFMLEGINFYITHGHLISVLGFGNLVERAARHGAREGAQVVLIGHLHYPVHREIDGVTVYCPGSVSQPRSMEGPTCLLLEIAAGKVLRHQFLRVKR